MLEDERRYSQHARRSLVRARIIAQEYAHPFVDTDHLLIGIWRTDNSLGYRILNDLQVERRTAENIVENLHPRLDSPLNPTPYSRALQTILLYASDEAYWLGDHYIGTEHLLLGLVRAGTGQLSSLLAELGISSHQLRQRIRRILTENLHESTREAIRRSASLSELSRRVLNAAEKLATESKHEATGLEHLLLILSREQRSITPRLLGECGLRADRLSYDMRYLQPDGVLAATALDEVLARAVDQADALGSHYVGTDHMLLAMSYDEEAIALMKRYGVEVAALREKLQAVFHK
jgi:ATP-dependent Clp protease ATP-binding subunit ClpC